jgi:DNA-directed RNA polymerase subunit RPC12/RpoP
VNRQERVPVVRTTVRQHYQCLQCSHSWFRDTVSQEEDFSPPGQNQSTVVVSREVLRIPCRFCGTLIDPIQSMTCPKCGAKPI